MSSVPKSIELIKIVNALKSLRTNISVPTRFHDRMDRINLLLSNDKTGIVSTVLDFMVHTATVSMRIETQNKTLDQNLKQWQKVTLNKNINIDIPRGLRELSTEYFRERWKSSFLALNVKWGKVKFEDGSTFEVPTRMWFADGGSLSVVGNPDVLNTKQYFIGRQINKRKQLRNTTNGSILIRKPFNSWYEMFPTPFLVKRGILFNALLKEAIITKQSDVIEAVIPYLLLLKAGTDKLAEMDMLVDEAELKKLKETVVKAQEEHDVTGELGKLIASLSYDVKIEHLIPDLTKIFNSDITNSTDKNLLAGLGLIELEGFAGNRKETILNPKVLIEEIKDAVADWASLLEEVMHEMMERNKRSHPKLSNNEIRVVPGTIKAFLTDPMKAMLRSLYDRGLLSKQRTIEDVGDIIGFEVEVERRDKENEDDLPNRMKPPVIQNLEQFEDPELEDQNKKPGTPEADNFTQAVLEHFGSRHLIKKKKKKKSDGELKTSFDNIDQLPDDIKNILPVAGQLLFLKVFNESFAKNDDIEQVLNHTWSIIEKDYEKKSDSDKWIKKASVKDYKNSMSVFVYKFFTDIYEIAFEKSNSQSNALTTALAVVEKFCKKNQSGIWVKDRSISKEQIASIDDPEVMEKLLDMELKQKKIHILNKILENKNGF